MEVDGLKPIEVVFIASFSFSGSTLLDVILGGHEEILSSGEIYLYNIHKKGYSEKGCTCGSSEWSCNYWTKVRKNLTFYIENYKINYITKLPKAKKLHIFNPKIENKLKSELLNEYQISTYFLYKSMLKVSGKKIVVDSSKNIPRLLTLINSPLFSLKLVFLQKKLENIFLSYRKRQMSTVNAAFRWIYYYFILHNLVKKNELIHRTYFLKYEDYVINPNKEIINLCDFLSIDFQNSMLNIDKNEYHIIGGNPMRYQLNEGIDKKKIKIAELKFHEKIFGVLFTNRGYFLLNKNHNLQVQKGEYSGNIMEL